MNRGYHPLLTYLSRAYMEQFKDAGISAEKLLLQQFHAKINECFRNLHEVGNYADLMNISSGHLSEVVKFQSGKLAIKHIHERLVLEASDCFFIPKVPSRKLYLISDLPTPPILTVF
jgi:AraC family transcriptional activator of pobA